jgi:hypothetical protein
MAALSSACARPSLPPKSKSIYFCNREGMMSIVSKRARLADMAFAGVRDFYFSSRYAHDRDDAETCDFTFGNPREMPLEGIACAIRARAMPQDKNWFAYKTSEPEPQAFLADRVGRELGLSFEPTKGMPPIIGERKLRNSHQRMTVSSQPRNIAAVNIHNELLRVVLIEPLYPSHDLE